MVAAADCGVRLPRPLVPTVGMKLQLQASMMRPPSLFEPAAFTLVIAPLNNSDFIELHATRVKYLVDEKKPGLKLRLYLSAETMSVTSQQRRSVGVWAKLGGRRSRLSRLAC